MSDQEDDKSLEEFFAKKSKGKKSKSKAKNFTTTKDITQKKQQTKSTTEENTEVVTKTVSQDEEQWKDFEAPAEMDYTGLRVQALQIDEEKEKDEEKENDDIENENEDQGSKDTSAGPWSKSQQAQQNPASEVKEPAAAAKPTGRYVPGAFKEKFKRERVGVAPDISSQAAFPTLSSAASDQNRSDFEMVKRGTKTRDSGIEGPSSVNLENRYDSLRK